METNDCVLFSDKQSILHFVTPQLVLDAQGFSGKNLQCLAVDLIQLVFSPFKETVVVKV